MDRKILWVGIGAFLFVALAAFAALLFLNPPGFRGAAYMEPLPPAPEIELTQADGGTFRLSDQRGRIVLLFFGYTSCPDVCPTTLAGLKLVLEELGDKAGSVQVLFISIDPGRDTPERAQEYVNHFDPSFIGLSGSQAELEKIWKDYGVFREIVEGASAAGYTVDHTARVTLIDQQGNLRLSYGFDTPREDIVHDLKLLLK